jgi:NADPH-dependent 2,4-dienoyl-CoA reductase/sulfur reductase-like enzyme/peroxiredoxin family protein/rhodanese-related sulfurtransferase/TusA-related sulfurtransferase
MEVIMAKKIIIVGGVAGGASTAARLRRNDEQAEIILLEKGEYISFANCGLPYYIGGEITDKDELTLQTPTSFKARFNVDVRNFNEAIKIDPLNKQVTILNHQTSVEYVESYDKLVLSMGAEPIRPPMEGINLSKVFTLRNIPDTYKIKEYLDQHKPQSALIVGGGYIGLEMAENLRHAGLQVTLVEMANQVIAPIDYDMACDVHRHIVAKGVNLKLETGLVGIRELDNQLIVTTTNGEVITDLVILAIGVKAETKIAKEAGLQLNQRGGIIVNEMMLTSDPDIYAVGDAVEVIDYMTQQPAMIPLAGPANKQGRLVADHICGVSKAYKGTQGSAILKVFDLTVAATGINEKTAQRLGLNYEKSFTYSGSHAGYYPGAKSMSIKTLFDKATGKILGAQIVGYDGSDKRCDVIATAIRFGATADDLSELELCYAPPYSSAKDPVNMVGFTIQNILQQQVKIYHWHDVGTLQQRNDVTLLDTRTVLEYDNGHISGYQNIPVDELRTRFNELDKTKPVYVTCQIGLRGYVACRILTQLGFDCYNLSGGYRLYKSIFGQSEKPVYVKMNEETQRVIQTMNNQTIKINACGLQCPGPIVKLSQALKNANNGDTIVISTTDPAFASDIEGFCRRTGNIYQGMTSDKGVNTATVIKGEQIQMSLCNTTNNGKNLIVFSGDLDKAIASFIIANASAALGRPVSMFFTFWGLNILRKDTYVSVKKDFISRMFGMMMPRGSRKLTLSKMNMGGMGAMMIRMVMKKKNVDSLEDLIKLAQESGVKLIACTMSMDVMGIKQEELIDGIELGGAAAMLAFAEESDMSLFI